MGLVTIVLPAYHEEKVICRVVASIHDVILASGFEYEIVIVGNGSNDQTCNQAKDGGFMYGCIQQNDNT